jgi:hypothetical protein
MGKAHATTAGEEPGSSFVLVLVVVGVVFFGPWRLGRRIIAGDSPDDGAARDLDDQILASTAVHTFAKAIATVLGDEPRVIELGNQVIDVMIRFEDHVPSASPVASVRAAFGAKRFAKERDAALAAVSGLRMNFDFVDEHDGQERIKKGEVKRPRPCEAAPY